MADTKPITDWLDAPDDVPPPRFNTDAEIDSFLDSDDEAAQPDIGAWLDSDEETWTGLGRKVVENAPAMFKQSAAGLAQKISEQPPNPALSVLMPAIPGSPVEGAQAAFSALQKRGTDWLREKLGMGPDESAATAAKIYADAEADLAENAPDIDPDSLKGYAYDAATSIIQMTPGIAASVAMRNPAIGAATMGAQVGGQQYGESRAAGRNPIEASRDAAFYAMAEGIPEALPLGVLMKAGKKFFGRVLSTAGAEGVSELMTQILQTGYDAGVLKEDMTWGEAVGAVTRAGILGTVTGGAVGAAAHPFVRDRGAENSPTNVAPDVPAAEPRPPGDLPKAQDSGATTTPPAEAPPTRLGPWSPPPMVKDATVGLKNKNGPPVRATIEGVQDGWVFWRDEDGNQQADREDEFRRDLTTPPPARRGDLGGEEPSGRPTPPPAEPDGIDDFDPSAIREPKSRPSTAPAPQRSLELSDTEQIKRLRERAQANITLMAEAQRVGTKSPQEIASYRVEAAKLMEEAAALERAIAARGDRQDPTAATPEQMAARGLGPLANTLPAASEATTGPQQFAVTPPKAPPAPAQGALAPVAGSEAENPQPITEQPKAPTVPWQQRLRQRIAARSARVNNPELLARQLGVTPQDVSNELTKIAGSSAKAPIQMVRGKITVDKKTGKVERSKYAGTFRYTPRPSENQVEDLADFILRMGGIRPTGSFAGELAARDLDKVNVPFKGKIVNPNARLSFQDMAEAAMQEGFMIPTDAGGIYGQSGDGVGSTSANLDKFMEMLDENANKIRRHFRLGEEPVAEEDRPATPRDRKAAAMARLAELGFEPKGTTAEELESQLDEYENAIGDLPPIDTLDLQRAMEMENVDRLGDEARNAVKEETGGDFPYEYDAEWFAAETAGSTPAALDEAAGGDATREGQSESEPDGEGAAGQGDQGADAPAADTEREAEGTTQTSRVDDADIDDSPAIDKTDDLKKHIEDGGTPDTWVLEQGYKTSNEHAAVSVDGEPRGGYTSNSRFAVSWMAPGEIAIPGYNVTVTHNHPNESVGGDDVALSPADLQPLQMPGFTFITAISHGGKVSSAALTPAGENWLYALTQDQSIEALMRLTGMAKTASLNIEQNDNLAQDLAMRILARAGLLEYHTTHMPRAMVYESQVAHAAQSIRKRMDENGFQGPAAGSADDVANRPTEHAGAAEALAAVQRRAKEIAQRRSREWVSPVGESGGGGQGGGAETSRISGGRLPGEAAVSADAEYVTKALQQRPPFSSLVRGFVYYSPLRPIGFGFPIKGEPFNPKHISTGGDTARVLVTNEPVSIEQLNRLELVPVSVPARLAAFKDAYAATPGAQPGRYELLDPKHRDDGKGAVITKSAKEPGRYQMTWFDQDGFGGDTSDATLDDALKSAMSMGFIEPSPGILSDMMQLDTFKITQDDRTTWEAPKPTPQTEKTDQGDQIVMPGMERSDNQALAARAAQPLIKSKKPQKPAGGMFAEPTGVIAKLFADESGTLTLPEWDAIKSYVTKLRGKKPATPQAIAREGLKIPLGDPNTLQSLSLPARWFRTAVSLASIDRPSSIYWNALLRRDHVKTTLEREAVEAVRPYLALDTKQRDRINKVLEYDRLFGIDRADTGRTVVVKVPDKRPPFGERPELSKPGEIIALDRTETAALHGLRRFFDKRLLQMGEAAAIERGYNGAFTKAAIQAEIDRAGNPQLRRIAQSALQVWEQTEEMRRTGYVPFQRYGDTYILIRQKAPETGIMEPAEERTQTSWFELVDTKSAFDKVFSRPGGKNRKPLDERVEELRKRFPPDKFEYQISQATPKAISELNIPALEKAFASLNLKKDAQSKQVIDQLMTQIFEARKAGLRKQANNVPGYSTDFERAISDYVRQSSSIVSHLASRRDVDSAYDTVQKHPVKEVRDYWEQHQHHMEKEGGDWAPVRKYGFFMFLWGNPASAAINLTQTPLVTQFQLATWAGPRAPVLAHHAMVQALKAVRPTKEGLAIDWDVLAEMLTEPEMAMIRTLKAEGRLDPVLSNEFRGFDRGRTKVRPHMGVLSRIYEIGASGFNTTETVNRIAAALAYFRAAQNEQLRAKAAKVYAQDQNWREMVGRFPQPIDIARFGVDETQFIGGKLNRMPAMRGMGGAILQFKTYIANYIRLLHKNFTRMGPQGKAAGAMMLIALLMASGLAGMPFADDVLSSYDFIMTLVTGIDSNLEYQFRNWIDDAGFGEYAAEIMTRGLGRDAFGVDVGGRLGMGNLFPDNSFSSLAPVLTGTIGKAANAVERYNSGQTAGAASELAPMFAGSGVGNLIRALIAWPEEGVATRKGTPLYWPDQVTTADMAIKAVGFQPARVTREGEKQFMAGRIANATKNARSSMLTSLTRAMVMEDRARAAGDIKTADKHKAQVEAILAKNAAQLLDPSIPDWQKLKPPSRLGVRRRMESMLEPDIARMKRAGKMTREELSDLPFVDEE